MRRLENILDLQETLKLQEENHKKVEKFLEQVSRGSLEAWVCRWVPTHELKKLTLAYMPVDIYDKLVKDIEEEESMDGEVKPSKASYSVRIDEEDK